MYTAAGQLDREQLVQQYLPLVRRIAHYLIARLPANVQLEDLVQNGMMGLLDALSRYEEGLGAQFETYASQRIRGAMLDGLRENDWLPRHLRREMRRVEAALQRLEQQHGRAPSETELAENLDMPLPQYQKLLQEARGHQLLYLEDFSHEEGDDFLERHLGRSEEDPSVLLENKDLRQNLTRAISTLPEREQLMMALYYDEELNLREIGAIMGVTESRVCQLHNQAISRIRSRLFGAGAGNKKDGKKTGKGNQNG
ncbi:MAG: RNA polymerase sigma factor FliA [Zoogloeaceae bacterium]|jgi:RNA polymerase sigma factor for flagellar operon FliA|nr:RNA polymerase sigma factor FliA [Zoogloeaceae bacterium]